MRKLLLIILFIFSLEMISFAETPVIYAPANGNISTYYFQDKPYYWGYTVDEENAIGRMTLGVDGINYVIPFAGTLVNGQRVKIDMINKDRFKMNIAINKVDSRVANTMTVYLDNEIIAYNSNFSTTPEDYWIWMNRPGTLYIQFDSINMDTGLIDPNTILTITEPTVYKTIDYTEYHRRKSLGLIKD